MYVSGCKKKTLILIQAPNKLLTVKNDNKHDSGHQLDTIFNKMSYFCFNSKQEGQEALNRSPEFCLNLAYRYLLKAYHVPGNTWGRAILVPGTYIEKTW